MGASPRSASPDLALPDNRGRQSTKGYPSSGGVVDPSHSGNLRPRLIGYSGSRRDANAPVTFITQERNSARDQASGVGVGTGSDCGEAFGARGRLCLGFVGSDAASSSTSDFDRERVVRLGLEVPSTSPSAASTFSSPFATADSAEIDAAAASAFGLRPRPSCFASDDRRSE
jgi:hypothetical protein